VPAGRSRLPDDDLSRLGGGGRHDRVHVRAATMAPGRVVVDRRAARPAIPRGPGQPPLDIWVAVSVGVWSARCCCSRSARRTSEPSPHVSSTRCVRSGSTRSRCAGGTTPGAVLVYDTVERDGGRTFVKLRTPDDRSWDLLTRLYRAIRLRSSEVARPFSTLKRRVEHEALALRTVRDGGTRCPTRDRRRRDARRCGVRRRGVVEGNPARDLPSSAFDDDLLRSVFHLVRARPLDADRPPQPHARQHDLRGRRPRLARRLRRSGAGGRSSRAGS
jgi:hypothetical protein